MNVQKLFVAGALLAFATPAAAFAQTQTNAPTQISAAEKANVLGTVLNELTPDHRRQVKAIISLEQSGQMDQGSAFIQIDSVLSEDEAKAVLAEAAKVHSDATDAGQFIASFAK